MNLLTGAWGGNQDNEFEKTYSHNSEVLVREVPCTCYEGNKSAIISLHPAAIRRGLVRHELVFTHIFCPRVERLCRAFEPRSRGFCPAAGRNRPGLLARVPQIQHPRFCPLARFSGLTTILAALAIGSELSNTLDTHRLKPSARWVSPLKRAKWKWEKGLARQRPGLKARAYSGLRRRQAP